MNDQRLIDIIFNISLTIKNSYELRQYTDSELAVWVAEQLSMCGFETIPQGMSWGVLKK